MQDHESETPHHEFATPGALIDGILADCEADFWSGTPLENLEDVLRRSTDVSSKVRRKINGLERDISSKKQQVETFQSIVRAGVVPGQPETAVPTDRVIDDLQLSIGRMRNELAEWYPIRDQLASNLNQLQERVSRLQRLEAARAAKEVMEEAKQLLAAAERLHSGGLESLDTDAAQLLIELGVTIPRLEALREELEGREF